MREPGKCLGKVWGGYQFHPCRHKAVTPAGYCKLHDPEIKKAKDDARNKKWHDKWEAQSKANAKAMAEQEELERKAALYDSCKTEYAEFRGAICMALNAGLFVDLRARVIDALNKYGAPEL